MITIIMCFTTGLGDALVAIVSLESLLAGVEGEEEEDHKDGAQDGEDDHPDHHVHGSVWPHVVVGHVWTPRELVGLLHEVAQGPAKDDFFLLWKGGREGHAVDIVQRS